MSANIYRFLLFACSLPLLAQVRNADFSKIGKDRPEFWGLYVSRGKARVLHDAVEGRGKAGAICFRVEPESRCTSTQKISVPAEKAPRFSLWLKGDSGQRNRAYLYLQWYDKKGGVIANTKPSPFLHGDFPWTEIAVVPASRPKEASAVNLVIVVENKDSKPAIVWGDDAQVTFEELPPPPALTMAPALRNSGFEKENKKEKGQPESWRQFVHGGNFILQRDTSDAHSGKACISLKGEKEHGDRACFLQVSPPFKPQKGLRLKFWYKGDTRPSGILRLRPQAGVKVPNGMYDQISFNCPFPKEEWTAYEVGMAVPKAARDAAAVCAEVLLYQRDQGMIRFDDVELESLEKFVPKLRTSNTAGLCPYRPEDGRHVLQNPPDFWWTPEDSFSEYRLQLAPNKEFQGANVRDYRVKTYNVFSLPEVLKPGEWFWRICARNDQGESSEWGGIRRFTVDEEAVPFPVPSATELLTRIPQSHPRVYATAASLEDFRKPLQGERAEWWARFGKRLENYLSQPVQKEPDKSFLRGKDVAGVEVRKGQKLRGLSGRATGAMQNLAFGYLLSGDRRYGDAAVARALEIATWDPEGPTSYRNHDQVFRDITWKLACTYDWCYDLLTEAQRQAIRQAVVVRGTTLYNHFGLGRPIYKRPYDSHAITAYGFLGICAIALAHDENTADEWFRFIAATYPAIFPPWGGEEGGWAQGTAYWKWSQPFAWWFFDALESATGFSLYDKAFCRNNGWFKLYMHPPWSKRHHFGDGNHGAPNATDFSNLARFAKRYRNPYFQWYANHGAGLDNGIFSYWWYSDTLDSRPPSDLPPGRYFSDIGWVAMHEDLGNPDTVSLIFKSSPMGSFNHSHADQNHFVLYAYGEPLLIDSGYYNWYNSPHDRGWTRQTKAHNAILVNGQGQQIFDMTAKGHIERHFSSPVADFAVGDATVSYKGKLERARRFIYYLRPDVFLLIDDLEAWSPATFTWAMHAEKEMQLNPEGNEVGIVQNDARCLVKFLAPEKLRFTQTDEFDVPLDTAKKEWHVYAETEEKSKATRFVTLLFPHRDAQALPKIEFDGETILLRKANGEIRDRIKLAFEGNEPTLMAESERGNHRFVFEVGPENASATKFAVGKGGLTPLGFWRSDDREGNVELNGKQVKLATGQREWKAAATQVAPQTNLRVYFDGKELETKLETMRCFDDSFRAWGAFPAGADSICKVELALAPGTSVYLGNQKMKSGMTMFPKVGDLLTLRAADNPIGGDIFFTSLLDNREPIPCPIVEAPEHARKIEAEDLAAHGGGSIGVYSHRPFLSGKRGLSSEIVGGQWLEWKISVERRQRYAIIINAAIFEENATRILDIDGNGVAGEHRVLQLPNTGGFGATPAEWKNIRLAEVELDPGVHTIRLMTLERRVNMDYLLISP